MCIRDRVIGLIGDLGTGKTALAGYIAEGLGITETISSPTFNIIKEYNSGRLPFYHFDVYRLTDPEELLSLIHILLEAAVKVFCQNDHIVLENESQSERGKKGA